MQIHSNPCSTKVQVAFPEEVGGIGGRKNKPQGLFRMCVWYLTISSPCQAAHCSAIVVVIVIIISDISPHGCFVGLEQ